MTVTPNTPEGRYMNRIERRLSFLKLLGQAEMGIYLASDPDQRKRSISNLARLMARQSELPHLKPDVLAQATNLLTRELEALQRVLPHDVQYQNRLKKDW